MCPASLPRNYLGAWILVEIEAGHVTYVRSPAQPPTTTPQEVRPEALSEERSSGLSPGLTASGSNLGGWAMS
jgi:hypothetical protein